MGDTIEVSRDAFKPITYMVKAGLFKNEKDALALSSLVHDQAAVKVHYFNTKIAEMQSKYKMSFQ